MQLTFHLFRNGITEFEDAINPDKLLGMHGFQEVALKKSLPFSGVAYLQRNKPRRPPWLSYVEQHCEIKEPKTIFNRSSAFVLLVKRPVGPADKVRIFAVTMGVGDTLLREDDFEPDFGLKVSMNSVAAKKLRSIQARNFGTAPVHRYLVASRDSTRGAFDIDSYLDVVASLEGIVKGADLRRTKEAKSKNKKLLGTRVKGSTSCSLTHEATFPELGAKFEQLWKEFNGNAYREIFPEYDNVRVVTEKSRIDDLNKLLGKHIGRRGVVNFCLALPTIDTRGMIDSYKVQYGNADSGDLGDLEVSELYEYLDQVNVSGEDVMALRLTGYSDGGGPVTSDLPVQKCAVWEVDVGNEHYCLTLGRWYRVDKEYIRRIDAEFEAKVKGKVWNDPMYLPRYPRSIYAKNSGRNGRVARSTVDIPLFAPLISRATVQTWTRHYIDISFTFANPPAQKSGRCEASAISLRKSASWWLKNGSTSSAASRKAKAP